jgi:hypothetical protein
MALERWGSPSPRKKDFTGVLRRLPAIEYDTMRKEIATKIRVSKAEWRKTGMTISGLTLMMIHDFVMPICVIVKLKGMSKRVPKTANHRKPKKATVILLLKKTAFTLRKNIVKVDMIPTI